MEPITLILATAVAEGLKQVGKQIVEKGIVDPSLEPATNRLKQWVQGRYGKKETAVKEDKALLGAVKAALKEAGAPTEDDDSLEKWAKQLSLDRLQASKNDTLRRQLARAALTFVDSHAAPPEELLVALGWPRNQKKELAQLLAALHKQLYAVEAWQPPLAYARAAAQTDLWGRIENRLQTMETILVAHSQGKPLLVKLQQEKFGLAQAAQVERKYRQELVQDLRLHDFRGIVQVKRAIRLPLVDIYQELGLLKLQGAKEREQAQELMLQLRDEERQQLEERRLQERVSDGLAASQRLAILGEPGAGKTISLKFIALMLALGYGIPRLGLEMPFIPLMIRLADYARALAQKPTLSLDNYLFTTIAEAYASHPDLPQFLRWALEKGGCMVLLDGLDEVGSDPVAGQTLKGQVVGRVQQFADRWCSDGFTNRVVVTSRIEGYWDEVLAGFDHVQLSPLQPPDEVTAFVLRWFTAYEQAQDSQITPELAEERAQERTESLVPKVLAHASVRRLATNPLLLTILALIHETVGKLPNRRIELYEICAQTLIESWRQAQTGVTNQWLSDLGGKQIIRIMAPLAYWLHENYPGGTATFAEWQRMLQATLTEAGFEAEAAEITHRFLHHARFEAGLLAERGLGQFGFFHLTFEEYLAARELARQPVARRREMLKAHWEDPRWHEIILLAAGQLGIVDLKDEDAGDFLQDLLEMEPQEPESQGRQAVLAGRALADIGPRAVTPTCKRWIVDALTQTMQDVNPDSKRPNHPPQTPLRSRFEAGEALDELGWLPDDLNAWVRCPGCAENGGDLLVMKYLVTNAHFAHFVNDDGYQNPAFWGGEQSEAWQWRSTGRRRAFETVPDQPHYWRDARFGQERRGFPVVGVSWYEAQAFAAWLWHNYQKSGDDGLSGSLQAHKISGVRLPHEVEWEKVAGGLADKDRYPWDAPDGPATTDTSLIVARANISEAKLRATTPVAMYPLGLSQPYRLADLAGNVWEWMENLRSDSGSRALRGGAWNYSQRNACVAARNYGNPDNANYDIGFR
ncbi:MAG: SUMF1/EgtB/PvdO family nonheme iron enzyme, partial [Candidatus Promineifilaceae bacterium]